MNLRGDFKISDRIFWIAVLLATTVGFGLRVYGVWENEFWTDELLAIRTSHTLESIQDHCFQRYSSPPLRYILTWLFLNYPHEDRLVRIPSLIAGTLAIGAAALLARKWFGPGAGFWTAWVMALNPWMVAYSQDGRMHIVAMFFYLSAILLAVPLPDRRRTWTLLLSGCCLAVSSAVTYAAVIVCFGGLLGVLLEMLRTSRNTFLRDGALFSGPWAVWMFGWLSVLWWVTSAAWAMEAPPAPIVEATAMVQTSSENPTPPPTPTPKRVPILDPGFYRESLANTWNDAPLKWMTLAGAVAFFLAKGGSRSLPRSLRLLLFVAPIAIILVLQPDQLYRRYLLSLLPFPLIGIGICLDAGATRTWRALSAALLIFILSIPPTIWVLNRPPQAWNAVRDHLAEHMEPKDQLLAGTHQAELAASYYLVGKIPTWWIVYNGFFQNRFREVPNEPGVCWLVQWYGIPPELEGTVLKYYDRQAEFPGRYGDIVVYREKNATAGGPTPDS